MKFSINGRDIDPDTLPIYKGPFWKNTPQMAHFDQIRPRLSKIEKLTDRTCKQAVYQLVIRQEHLVKDNIEPGPYLGLCGAASDIIFATLSPYIQGRMINCINVKKDFKALQTQGAYLRGILRRELKDKVLFRNRLDHLPAYMLTTKEKFSIFDGDYMCAHNDEMVKATSAGIDHCMNDRCVVAMWYGSDRRRGGGDHIIDGIWRPRMKDLFWSWNVIRHTKVNYSNSYPMRVDVFTLERK